MSQQGYTEQITRLIEQQGAARARAAEQSGQIWGGALANIGQIPAQIQQQKRAAQQGQLTDLEIKARTQEQQDQQAMRGAVQSSGGDLEKALPQIMATNPVAGLKLSEAIRQQKTAALASQKAVLDYHKEVSGVIADHMGPVADAPDPESQAVALKNAHERLAAMGIPTDDLPTQPGPEATAKAASLRQAAMSAKDQLEAKHKDLDDQIKALTAASQDKARQVEAANKAADNARLDAAAGETGRHNKAMESASMMRARTAAANAAGQEAAPTLTPAGLDVTAENFAKTGQLPPMGMGKAGAALRAKIINRAAELHPDLDIASNKAGFGADSQSLKKMQAQRDAIGSFEQTAMKNIDIFLDTAGKVVDTGSPLANTFIRAASAKILGSPDQAKYDAARQVAVNEIAKITTNPNLSGALSDNARHEVEAYNPQNATLKQTVAVMRLLKQDMANRTTAMDQQIAAIKGRIDAGGAKTGDTPKATMRFNPATGKVEPIK